MAQAFFSGCCLLCLAVCGTPPDFCEFGDRWPECKKWIEKNNPELLPFACPPSSVSLGRESGATSETDKELAEGMLKLDVQTSQGNEGEAPGEAKKPGGGGKKKVEKPVRKGAVSPAPDRSGAAMLPWRFAILSSPCSAVGCVGVSAKIRVRLHDSAYRFVRVRVFVSTPGRASLHPFLCLTGAVRVAVSYQVTVSRRTECRPKNLPFFGRREK